MKPRCPVDHRAVAADPEKFAAAEFVGYQKTEDDDGNPAHLIMRNCACGNTMSVFHLGPVPS